MGKRKNMKNFVLFLICLSVQLYSYDTQGGPTRFFAGDIVEVDFCDKYNWCRLKNKTGYIRSFGFLQNDDMTYKSKALSFLYAKRPIFDDDNSLIDYLLINDKIDSLKAFAHGYVKVEDIIEYEQK